MSGSTHITAAEDLYMLCGTQLPTHVVCYSAIKNTHLFKGDTIDFQIEQPNYKTVEKNEKYFDGTMRCYANTDASIRSEVRHFSVSIKSGRFSFQLPQFSSEYATGDTLIICHGTDLVLPANFGVVKTSSGADDTDQETNLRIRAEYKRSGISRQFADNSSLGPMLSIQPPGRFHGNDIDGNPVPYTSLAKSFSIESSGTIFDAGKGLKFVLKDIQHNMHGLSLSHQSASHFSTQNPLEGPRFASLDPLNTYRETSRGQYVNCTAEVAANGVILSTFDTTMELLNESFQGDIKFETRDLESYGNWKKVDVDTINTDFSLSCPTLTILNPTEFPVSMQITGTFSGNPYSFPPTYIYVSSVSSITSTIVLSVSIIAAGFLSMF